MFLMICYPLHAACGIGNRRRWCRHTHRCRRRCRTPHVPLPARPRRAHCCRTSRHAGTLLPLLPVLLAATAAAAAPMPLQPHMPAAFDCHFTKGKQLVATLNFSRGGYRSRLAMIFFVSMSVKKVSRLGALLCVCGPMARRVSWRTSCKPSAVHVGCR